MKATYDERYWPHTVEGIMRAGMQAFAERNGPWPRPVTVDDQLTAASFGSAGVWCANGFPAIEMGHKTAAALMSTAAPDELRVPWSCFLLYLPTGLLQMPCDKGEHDYLSHVLMCYGARVSRFVGDAEIPDACQLRLVSVGGLGFSVHSSYSELRHESPSLRMASADADASALAFDDLEMESDRSRVSHMKRLLRCVVRFVANTCALMAEPTNVQRVGKGHAAPAFGVHSGAVAPIAKTQLFRIGRPVVVDCRDSVRDYIAGRRSALRSVRWLVRGHWTHQAHGPEHSLRRLQWIEPYWKGADDAPINVRPHILARTPNEARS